MTGFGASRPLPCVAAKVPSPFGLQTSISANRLEFQAGALASRLRVRTTPAPYTTASGVTRHPWSPEQDQRLDELLCASKNYREAERCCPFVWKRRSLPVARSWCVSSAKEPDHEEGPQDRAGADPPLHRR